MAIDSRVNIGIVIKGELTEIERLLKVIESQLRDCKIVTHRISSRPIWIKAEQEGDSDVR